MAKTKEGQCCPKGQTCDWCGGVTSGPYKAHYDAWKKTLEGKAIAAEEWNSVNVEEIERCPRGQPAREAEAKRQGKLRK